MATANKPKRAADKRPKQLRIPGTEVEIPANVANLRDDYVDAKRNTQKWREKMNGHRDELITAMKEAGIETLEIDDGEKILRQVDKPALEIKNKKKGNQETSEGGEE